MNTKHIRTQPLQLTPSLHNMASSPTLAINEAIAARRAARHTGYAPVLGIAPLRVAIADYLARTRNLAFTPDHIAVAPGSKPLLYALLQVLEGDLLLPAPSWVSDAPHARLAGRRVITVETDPGDHHRLTPQTLTDSLSQARQQGANPRI